MTPKKLWYIFLLIGITSLSFWGTLPGTLISTKLLTYKIHISSGKRIFLLVIAFYGYSSLILIFSSLIFEYYFKNIRLKLYKKKVFKNIFNSGNIGKSKDEFLKLCMVTDETLRKLIREKKDVYTYQDFLIIFKYKQINKDIIINKNI